MFKLKDTKEVTKLIEITKSNSGVSGPKLVKAHIALGELLGKEMNFPKEDTTIVAVMRGGIFFAQGIYFSTDYKFMTYDPKLEPFKRPDTKYVILVDSVINTGNTLIPLLDDEVYVASCVINERAVEKFNERLYTARVSKNSYVGSEIKKQIGNKGPDTTMRLFNQL